MTGEELNILSQRPFSQQVAPPAQQQQENKDQEGKSNVEKEKQGGKDSTQTSKQASQQSLNQRIKGLNEEDLVKHFKEQVAFLRDVPDEAVYSSADALRPLCQLTWMYFDYRQHREKLAAILSEMNYAETSLRMITYYNQAGVFSSDDTWKPCYYTYNSLWNYSDASRDLGKNLAEKGHVKLLAANIGHQPYLNNMQSKNVYYLLKASLSIMQNISRVPEMTEYFDEAGVKQLLDPYLKNTDDFLRAVSTMVLSSIITEKENSLLEDAGGMQYIILCLSKAVRDKTKRRYRGFCPAELAECLGRMAVNDKNKAAIVDAGVLPLLVDMLQHPEEEEQTAAARALWTLAFDSDVRGKIQEEKGCLQALQALTTSEKSNVRHMAKGALWVLADDHKTTKADGAEEKIQSRKAQHLFISYSWDNQEAVVEIKNKLKACGYRVWIDVEQMGGSTLEAMAEAVENACVVIICVSEKYKLSPNARTEAEYTFQLKKPIVPLMMQRHYKPDGWLGMLLGSKFYINFDGKYEFEEAFEMLERELNERGRGFNTEQSVDVADSGLGLASAPTRSDAGRVPKEPEIVDWTTDRVADWMGEHKLHDIKEHFSQYDGRLLNRFIKLKKEAPEFFHNYLNAQMGLTMLQILRLAEALAALPK